MLAACLNGKSLINILLGVLVFVEKYKVEDALHGGPSLFTSKLNPSEEHKSETSPS